jgi:hypothetical protein
LTDTYLQRPPRLKADGTGYDWREFDRYLQKTSALLGEPTGNPTNIPQQITNVNTITAQVLSDIQALQVPASGNDIDTGTNDTNYVTAKALKDSKNVPDVIPGTVGNVITSDGTKWISSAGGGGSISFATAAVLGTL